MLLGSFVHWLLSLGVRGAPSGVILDAFGASVGSLGLPSVPLGVHRGASWAPFDTFGDPLGCLRGGHLGDFSA